METPDNRGNPMSQTTELSLDNAKKLLSSDLQGLIDQLAQMSSKEARKLSPLMWEAASNRIKGYGCKVIKTLLGVRPEWVDVYIEPGRNTSLMHATRVGNLDLVDILLEHGADPRKKNTNSYDALSIAVSYHDHHRFQEAVVDTILKSGKFTQEEKSFALGTAAHECSLGAVRSLLKHGARFSTDISRDHFANHLRYLITPIIGTALHVACSSKGSFQIIQAMLENEHGLEIINHGWDNPGFGSPLHCAAANEAEGGRIIPMLLEKGAQVNPPDYMQGAPVKTPLMRAAESFEVEAIELLVKAGADVGLVDAEGKNAGHYLADTALSLGRKETMERATSCFHALISAGVDFRGVDKDGFTPAELARNAGKDELASYFDQYMLDQQAPQVSQPALSRSGPRI